MEILTFIFSVALAIGISLLIWMHTPNGKRWLDAL